MISPELAAGIERYKARVAPLLGRTVTITTPDGVTHTGTFGDASECQPCVTQADGRQFIVSHAELDRLVSEDRPYHERRREMAHCPECLDPDCYSLVCDEPELRDPAYRGD